MRDPAVVRDVQAQLLSKKISRRRPGHYPYPLTHHSNDDFDFEIWDHLFLINHCRRLTIHQLHAPPLAVLDLGCGTGYWAIQAAKQWPTTIVTGYDILHIQPQLDNLDLHEDVAPRIRWIHGNFLDGLPFPCDHFDLVHISRIGLGVPEDEWQSLLEEVARIMKPGGVLEIIEEDPIFPYCQSPVPDKCFSTLLRNSSSRSSPFLTVDSDKSSENLPSRPLKHAYSPKAVDSIAKRFRLGSYRRTTLSDASLPQGYRSADSLTNQTSSLQTLSVPDDMSTEDPSHTTNPIDHARLKLAWEALLSNRFLPLNLLSVLPFYLSTSFVRIQTHPPLNIPLPPMSESLESSNIAIEWPTKDTTSDPIFHLTPFSSLSPSTEKFTPLSSLTPISTVMHLAKSVNTIKRCKEPIWEEYASLFAANRLPNIVSNGRNVFSLRETFEADWKNWLNDMEDRVGMRRCLTSQFPWEEPPGDKPEWKSWREELDPSFVDLQGSVCRSIRAFVAWKAA